jgi:hypothetical protein
MTVSNKLHPIHQAIVSMDGVTLVAAEPGQSLLSVFHERCKAVNARYWWGDHYSLGRARKLDDSRDVIQKCRATRELLVDLTTPVDRNPRVSFDFAHNPGIRS